MADATVPFKRIPINHKETTVYALVDAEDYPVLSRHTWHLTGPKLYPATFLELENGKRRLLSLHRMIMGGVADLDHINMDIMDARKANLRKATYQQNGWNKPKTSKCRHGKPMSKYKGVTPYKSKSFGDGWQVIIKLTKKGESPTKFVRLKPFKTEEEAALAYNEEVVKHRGEYAWLNQLPPQNSDIVKSEPKDCKV